jgi:rhodanese-related sulfurtransferase
MVESISVYELKKLNNINIIDIRSIEKYNSRHIPNSMNISYEKILTSYNKYLDKNKEYYIYCQKGIQSRKLCQILKNNGFNVINITGGYEAWVLSE